jgi:hypothetical protein
MRPRAGDSALALQHVGAVHAGRGDADPHFARTGRRIRPIGLAQHLRRPEPMVAIARIAGGYLPRAAPSHVRSTHARTGRAASDSGATPRVVRWW